jgi:ankyrin repeat protein
MTQLLIAAKNGDFETVQFLVENGANKYAKDKVNLHIKYDSPIHVFTITLE